MAKQYIANRPFGGLKAGEEVTGLNDERIEFLLNEGVIAEMTTNDSPASKADNKTKAKPESEPDPKTDKETA